MKLTRLLKAIDRATPDERWAVLQQLAEGRFYGDGGTIHTHTSRWVDVEIHEAHVVSVWFRCQLLPFQEHAVTGERAVEMFGAYDGKPPGISGVFVVDGA